MWNKSILFIEDDLDTGDLVKFVFSFAGYEIITAQNAQEGVRLAKTQKFAAIILDYYLIESNGLEVCEQIRLFDKITPIVFYSCENSLQIMEAAFAAGAQKYFVKPCDVQEFSAAVIKLIEEAESLK